MDTSNNQIKILVWPSKKRDLESIDRDGHVELLLLNKCVGFFADSTTPPIPRTRDIYKRGCKGEFRVLPLAEVELWYFTRACEEYEEDKIHPNKNRKCPPLWFFSFKASDESIQKISDFLESKIHNPPRYVYHADKPGCHNCQTISREALAVSGIFKEPSFTSALPDDLLDLLLKKKDIDSRIIEAKKTHLTYPSFVE